MVELQRRSATTFVIVTHDQEEAMAVADDRRDERGKLVQVGAPHDVYEKPVSRWVAGFVGDVNLIEGRVKDGEGLSRDVEPSGEAVARLPQPASRTRTDRWLRCVPRRSGISPSPPIGALETARPAVSRSAISARSRTTRCSSTTGSCLWAAVMNESRGAARTSRVNDHRAAVLDARGGA